MKIATSAGILQLINRRLIGCFESVRCCAGHSSCLESSYRKSVCNSWYTAEQNLITLTSCAPALQHNASASHISVWTTSTRKGAGYNRDHDHESANKIRFLVIFKLNGVEISTLNIHFHFLSDYSCSNLHREYNHEFAKLLYSCTCFLWAMIKIDISLTCLCFLLVPFFNIITIHASDHSQKKVKHFSSSILRKWKWQ